MEEYFKPDPDKMEDVVISKVKQQKIRECVFVGAAVSIVQYCLLIIILNYREYITFQSEIRT